MAHRLFEHRFLKLLKLIHAKGGVPCEQSPAFFFPEDIPNREQRELATLTAKAICRTCPIVEECFTYAIETNQRHGIWGATSPDER
jgi:WhiB family transcriptional regulator, redox-sensing transcriptional regulator